MRYPSLLCPPMSSHLFSAVFLLAFVLSLLLFLPRFRRVKEAGKEYTHHLNHNPLSIFNRSVPQSIDITQRTHVSNLTRLAHLLRLDILLSTSSKWSAALFSGEACKNPNSILSSDGCAFDGEESGKSGDEQKEKKKKRRTKKKRTEDGGDLMPKKEPDFVCLYPFTSSSSLTQRKIKQQYDHLMKCHEAKGLTLAQVGQFVNCLVEAKKELLNKFDAVQRKFTITKALLLKADRSSFDRLSQQIYKLELEQKRLEEDAFVFNWLQQQLKLSQAYKKLLEISCMEVDVKSDELMGSKEGDFTDISFEEFLAQEKKDSFWQKNGKLRACST